MHVKLLRQFGKGLLSLERGQRNFCLECGSGAVVLSWSFLAFGNHADLARIHHLTQAFKFPEPPLLLRQAFAIG